MPLRDRVWRSADRSDEFARRKRFRRRGGRNMKIGVLFDGISALGTNPDLMILESVEAIEDAISDWGHEHVRVPVNPDGRWVERVRKANFDLVFNL